MSGTNSTISDVSGVEDATDARLRSAEQTAVDAETETDQQAVPDLPIDVVFEVLKNQRRRHVVRYLQEHAGAVELGPLAEHIAAIENDKPEKAITYAERKRVYVGLYQCHLPKMDDVGVIEFNQARGWIEATTQTEQLLEYLDEPERSRPWHAYYGAISLLGIGLYGSALTDLIPALLPPAVTILVVLAAFAVCSFWHFSVEAPVED